MARFSPDLAATLLPGCSAVPFADWDIFFYLQAFYNNDRVGFADRGRRLVQEIAAGIRDIDVNTSYFGFGLLPVVAELLFPGHHPLIAFEPVLVLLEAVERFDKSAVAERGKASYADIDPDRRCGRVNRLLYFPPGLDRDEVLPARHADRDVAEFAVYLAAIAIEEPAQFGKEDAVIALFELNLLWIGITKTLVLPFLAERRRLDYLSWFD